MKRKQIIDFLTVVLFFGVIVSCMLYIGIGLITSGSGDDEAPSGPASRFSSSFYNDEQMQSLIRKADYNLFRHSNTDNIMIGKENWIFDTVRTDNGYDYLLDYVGGSPLTPEQLQTVSDNFAADREYYAQKGIEYIVVVIPSSMTVCTDKLPGFLGNQSENTRRAMLAARLSGEDAYIDTTEQLRAAAMAEQPYNNTEDTLNAYGAYFIYDAVMSHIKSVDSEFVGRISFDDLEFSIRMTDGKGAARRAGLEDTVLNRTISLTDEMTRGYDIIAYSSNCQTTRRNGELYGSPRLLLELPSEWDRIQLMPLFSNTFDTVIYEQGDVDLRRAVNTHKPQIVVRMIRESSLQRLF